MKSFIQNHKIIIRRILVTLMTLVICFYYYSRSPQGVEAQTCITIRPNIVYGTQSNSVTCSGPTTCCGGTIVNVPLAGSGNPWVAMTGWELNYTGSNHEIQDVKIALGNPVFDNSSVSFTVNACLYDTNADDNFSWRVRYVVVRWR